MSSSMGWIADGFKPQEDRLRLVEAQLSDVLAAQNSTNRNATRQQSASPIPSIRFSRPERRPSELNGYVDSLIQATGR